MGYNEMAPFVVRGYKFDGMHAILRQPFKQGSEG